MKICHTIDALAVVDIQVSHMYDIVLVNDRHALIGIFFFGLDIQHLDHRDQLRHSALQIPHRPLLQSLCQDCMIGVRTGL